MLDINKQTCVPVFFSYFYIFSHSKDRAKLVLDLLKSLLHQRGVDVDKEFPIYKPSRIYVIKFDYAQARFLCNMLQLKKM